MTDKSLLDDVVLCPRRDDWTTLRFQYREDGGIRICSDDVPGLILAGTDVPKVWAEVLPIIKELEHRNRGKTFSAAPPEPNAALRRFI